MQCDQIKAEVRMITWEGDVCLACVCAKFSKVMFMTVLHLCKILDFCLDTFYNGYIVLIEEI